MAMMMMMMIIIIIIMKVRWVEHTWKADNLKVTDHYGDLPQVQ